MKNINVWYLASTVLAISLAAFIPPAHAAGEGYIGEIIEDNTEVRSGPSDKAYECAVLNKAAKVKVISEISEDWLVVSQPGGCFSVIGQENVALSSKSEKKGKYRITPGRVIAERATLFAAGLKRKNAFTAPQVHLKKGATINKIGSTRDGLWYILLPPENARFYIRANKVRRAGSEPKPEPKDTDLTPIEFKPVPKEIKPPVISDTTKTPKTPESIKPETDYSVKQLQDEVLQESQKPIATRNFNALLQKSKQIKVAKGSSEHATYTSLLKYIKNEIEVAKKTREIDNIVSNALSETTPMTSVPETSGAAGKFDLEGTVTVSSLYSLDPKEMRRYRVIDPVSGRNIGYAIDPGGNCNLRTMVGKKVGLNGEFEFNNSLGMQVLKVNRAKLLEPNPVTPTKIKPIRPEPVKPEPVKPEPVRPVKPIRPEPVKPEPVKPLPVKPEPVKPEPVKPVPVKPEPVRPVKPIRPEPVKPVPVKPEPVKPVPVKPEPVKPEPVKPVPVKPEPVKPEPVKPLPVKPEPVKPEPVKPVPVKPEPVKPEPVKPLPVKPEPVKPEPVKPLPVKPEPVKPEPVKPLPVKPEPVKPEPVKPLPVKPEPIRPEPIKPVPIKPVKIDPVKPEPIKPEPIRPMPIKPEPIKIGPDAVKPEMIKPEPIKPEPITPEPISAEPKKPEIKRPVLKVPVVPASTKEGVEIEWD